jgi:two-component system chemotaxis response regulator CheY
MARVLLVDDSTFIRAMVKRLLEREGHEVVGEASDGAQALERFAELQPELTIMDIVMPGRDGLKVLQSLRRIVPSARVLIYSAYPTEDKQREAIRAGATAYLTKTTDSQPLLDSVEFALAY